MTRMYHVACLLLKTRASAQPAVSVGIVGDAPGAIPAPGRDDPSQVTFSYEATPSVARGGAAVGSLKWRRFADGHRTALRRCTNVDLRLLRRVDDAGFLTQSRLECEPSDECDVITTERRDERCRLWGREGASINVWPSLVLSIEPDEGVDDGGDVVIMRGRDVGHLLRSVGSVDCVFGGRPNPGDVAAQRA